MSARAHFVAEIVSEGARDPWRPDRAPVPTAIALPHGAYVEVRVERGVAHPIDGGLVASPGSAMASLVRIAADHALDPVFSPEVEREVAALVAAPGIDDPTLVDLTHVPFVTIDNEGSRDLDQALHVEGDGHGHRVRYAIADASHYVRPGTALFAEALARGASFYLPGWAVPMLPRALSEGLVSLNARVPRRALVFDMRLDAAGACIDAQVVHARIESRAKLTYDGVQRYLDDPGGHAYAREPFAESLVLLREVGERRIADAAARDVVQHRRVVVEIGQSDRRSFVALGGLRNDVERYNEQLSLLCNVEGARMLRDAEGEHVQPIYRVHPAPAEDRVRALETAIEQLVRVHALDPARWCWRRASGQSLASYLRSLPTGGPHARVARALERQAILVNVRSSFSDAAGAHYGVGAEVYARFSAPMREIVGVFLHKELCEHLQGPAGAVDGVREDERLRERVIDAANRARSLQRRIEALADRLALDAVFERDVARPLADRPVRSATVMGIGGGKVYLALDDPPLEVKLYRADLERSLGPLALGPSEATLERADGSVVATVGAAQRVVVARRDATRDRWVLELCEGS